MLKGICQSLLRRLTFGQFFSKFTRQNSRSKSTSEVSNIFNNSISTEAPSSQKNNDENSQTGERLCHEQIFNAFTDVKGVKHFQIV